jgi:hypothetical protein
MKIHVHVQDRTTRCTPVAFLFALQMKYASKIADITSTATTTEATKITVLFLDAFIFLLHVLLLESCLKCIRQQGQSFTLEGGVLLTAHLFRDPRNRYTIQNSQAYQWEKETSRRKSKPENK